MLQNLGAGNAALLVDVSYHERRVAAVLGRAHDAHGTLPHLADAARRRGGLRIKHGLDRVYDQNRRLQFINGGKHSAKVCLRQHVDAPLIDSKALCAHFELALALFTGDI